MSNTDTGQDTGSSRSDSKDPSNQKYHNGNDETIRASNVNDWLQQTTTASSADQNILRNAETTGSASSAESVFALLKGKRDSSENLDDQGKKEERTSEDDAKQSKPPPVAGPQIFFDGLFREPTSGTIGAKKEAKPHHTRTVSWDASVLHKQKEQGQEPRHILTQRHTRGRSDSLNENLLPPPYPQGRILSGRSSNEGVAPSLPPAMNSLSLEDVLKHAPFETETGRDVMRHVEATDVPSRTLEGGNDDSLPGVPVGTGQHILPNVPIDAILLRNSGDSDAASSTPPQNEDRGSMSQRTVRSSTEPSQSDLEKQHLLDGDPCTFPTSTSVEERLEGLTTTLEALHQMSTLHKVGEPVVPVASAVRLQSGMPYTATDKLNTASDALFKRHHRKDSSKFTFSFMDDVSISTLATDEGSRRKRKSPLVSRKAPQLDNSAIVVRENSSCMSEDSTGRKLSAYEAAVREEHNDIETGLSSIEQPHLDHTIIPVQEENEGEMNWHMSPLKLQPKHQTPTSKAWRCILAIPGLRDFATFVRASRGSLLAYFAIFFWIVFPAFAAACILFYLADNPPVGRVRYIVNGTKYGTSDKIIYPDDQASYSFMLIFYSIRQLITFTLAIGLQTFVIDFLCVGRQWTARFLGPAATLLIVQSRGWPFIAIFWSLFDMGLNFGSHKVRNFSLKRTSSAAQSNVV